VPLRADNGAAVGARQLAEAVGVHRGHLHLVLLLHTYGQRHDGDELRLHAREDCLGGVARFVVVEGAIHVGDRTV
jgi:hypothetical protein